MGSRYLDHLIVERKYAEAASLCPKLLRGSASAWERYPWSTFCQTVFAVLEIDKVVPDRWVFHFAHLRQLPSLVPYMPIADPRLSDTAYEVQKCVSFFFWFCINLCAFLWNSLMLIFLT